MNFAKSLDEETYKKISLLTSTVIHRRKTYPSRLMKLHSKKVERDIAHLETPTIDLKNEITNMEISSLCGQLRKEIDSLGTEDSSAIIDRLRNARQNQVEIEQYMRSLKECDVEE